MSNTPSLPRRLTVLTAGLAACLAGLVATAAGPQAAPPAAPVAVPAAARTPDSYTPRPGALFNKPTGTRAQQYRLFTHPDTCAVPWRSTGWTNNQNVIKLLDFMVQRGEVAIAGRKGRERLYDLASRVYPDDPVPSFEDAERIRNERRLRALGIARATGTEFPHEPSTVGEVGEPATVEGVKGTWRVDPAYLGQPFSGRTALLSPFDRLTHDRKRTLEIFEFDYRLEMYKPAAQRRWGYFALPILHGDRLVGKLDATADRKAGVLRVDAVHEDVPFSRPVTAAVRREIEDLARWLGVAVALPGTVSRG